jgi:hypothetical protein
LIWKGRGWLVAILSHSPALSIFLILYQAEGNMNIGLFIGIAGVFALLLFQDYFFGQKDIDDSQGFPYSRRNHKWQKRNGKKR